MKKIKLIFHENYKFIDGRFVAADQECNAILHKRESDFKKQNPYITFEFENDKVIRSISEHVLTVVYIYQNEEI